MVVQSGTLQGASFFACNGHLTTRAVEIPKIPSIPPLFFAQLVDGWNFTSNGPSSQDDVLDTPLARRDLEGIARHTQGRDLPGSGERPEPEEDPQGLPEEVPHLRDEPLLPVPAWVSSPLLRRGQSPGGGAVSWGDSPARRGGDVPA